MLDYVTDKCSGDYPICCGEKPKVYVETRPTKNWGNLIMHCKNGSEKWHKDPSNGYLGYTVVSNRPPPVEWAYNNEVFPNVREQVEIARRKRGEATQLEISSLWTRHTQGLTQNDIVVQKGCPSSRATHYIVRSIESATHVRLETYDKTGGEFRMINKCVPMGELRRINNCRLTLENARDVVISSYGMGCHTDAAQM